MILELRHSRQDERERLWQLIYGDLSWKEWDAPYWPIEKVPTLEEYLELVKAAPVNPWRKYVALDGELCGLVNASWEDAASGWAEAGIVLYRPGNWGRGLGRRALTLWLEELFADARLHRVSLTTWSGNERMVKLALSLGFTEEARMREARLWRGRRWDSVRYGILRREWRG